MNMLTTYCPDETEVYMNTAQLEYFERKLRRWHKELITVSDSSRNELKETGLKGPDFFDVASAQAEIIVDLEELRRRREQIANIEKALVRIKTGEYGYCKVTGEKIGIRRLEIQPFATLCVEAQEMLERVERGVLYSKVQQASCGSIW